MRVAIFTAKLDASNANVFTGRFVRFDNIARILSQKHDVRLFPRGQSLKVLHCLHELIESTHSTNLPNRMKLKCDINKQNKREKEGASLSGEGNSILGCTEQRNLHKRTACRARMLLRFAIAILLEAVYCIIDIAHLFVLSFRIALKYDLIISYDLEWLGAASTLCAKMCGGKSIIVLGGSFEEISMTYKGLLGKLRLWWFSIPASISIRLADGIISDRKVTELIKKRRIKTTICSETGAVDLNQFQYDGKARKNYRERLGIPDSAFVLLFAGRLMDWDGADTAFKVFRALSKEWSNLWLILIGSGNLEENIKETIIRENLQRVILTGFVSHSEIHNYMMTGDIGLLPLRPPQTGIGMIPPELMALGIPIIGTDVGDFRNVIIDGKTGFLVKGEVIEDMVKKVNLLLENRELLGKMRINARRMIEQDYSFGATSARIFSLIDACINP